MNKTLNKKIWNSDKTLKKEIRINLLQIAKDFFKYLDVENVKLKDILFTGSMANYNFHSKSDIDLHLLLDLNETSNKELTDKLLQSKKTLWNLFHKVTIKGYDVEVYPEDIDKHQMSSGMFSLIKNKWIVEPKYKDIKYNKNLVLKKAKLYQDMIDKINDDFINKKRNEDVLLNELTKIKDKIVKARREGIKTDGEFSNDNLIFKILRNTNYLKKINTLIYKIYDKKMSIMELNKNE